MFDSLGRFCSPRTRIGFHKKNDEAFKFLSNNLEKGVSVSESIHCALFNIDNRPKCEFCNKDTKFRSFLDGFSKTCGGDECLKAGYGKNPHIPTKKERDELSKRMRKNNPMFNEDTAKRVMNTQRMNNKGIMPMHSEKSKEKALNSRYDRHNTFAPNNNNYKPKIYKTRSGKDVWIQGYEGFALDILEKNYKGEDIVVCGRSHSFLYEFNGTKRYYPDFFIFSEKKYIEVKSLYTYNVALEQNLAKQKAVKNAGFKFEFWIFNKDGDLINL